MLLKRTFDKETDDMDKTQARDPAAVLREMVIGTAYYPEHWPRERWQTDIDLMARAGIRVVRLAELAWSGWNRRTACSILPGWMILWTWRGNKACASCLEPRRKPRPSGCGAPTPR